jgi:hypothetical protein
MPFLVVDDRFGTPIYVLLELDPRAERGFPGLPVREIILEPRAIGPDHTPGSDFGVDPTSAVGRDPARLDRFREFISDRAVGGAGFILIEPRYVGPSWPAYLTAYRPEGQKPLKRSRDSAHASRGG